MSFNLSELQLQNTTQFDSFIPQLAADDNENDNLTMPSPFKRILNKTSEFEDSVAEDQKSYHEEQIKKIHYLEYELSNLQNQSLLDKLDFDKKTVEFEKTLKRKDQEIETLSSNEKFLFEQNQELTKELSELKEEKAQLFKQKDSEIGELRNSLTSKQDECLELKFKLESLISKNRMMEEEQRTRLSNSQDDIKVLNEELESQLASNREKSEKIRKLEAQIEQLAENKSNGTGIESSEDAQFYQRQFGEKVDQIKQLESKLKSYEAQISKLSHSNELVGVLKEERNLNLKKLENLKRLSLENDELKLKLNRINGEYLKWEEVFKANGQNAMEFFNSTKLSQQEIKTLKGKVIDLTLEINRLNDKIQQDLNEINLLREQRDEYKLKVSNLNMTVLQDKNLRTLLEQEIEFNKTQFEFLNNENKLLLQKAADKPDADKHILIIQDKQKAIDDLNLILNNYKSELAMSVERLKDQEQKTIELNQNSKRLRTNDGESVKLSSTTHTSDAVKEITNLKMELETSNSKNHILQQSIDELKGQIESLEREIENKKFVNVEQVENDEQRISKSVYDRLLLEQRELQDKLFESSKRQTRLKEAFEKQITRVNQIIYQLFNIKLVFETNTKIQLHSHKFGKEEYLIVTVQDSESEGPNELKLKLSIEDQKDHFSSLPALVLNNLFQYWIEEKKDISCFISALNLELFEKTELS